MCVCMCDVSHVMETDSLDIICVHVCVYVYIYVCMWDVCHVMETDSLGIMCVCVCVFIHVCVCVCVCVMLATWWRQTVLVSCMWVCVYLYTCMYVWWWPRSENRLLCSGLYTCKCTCIVCVHVCTLAHAYVHKWILLRTHIDPIWSCMWYLTIHTCAVISTWNRVAMHTCPCAFGVQCLVRGHGITQPWVQSYGYTDIRWICAQMYACVETHSLINK
jgi:hypothetical protein